MPTLPTYTHASSNQCEQPLCPTSYLCRPRFNIRNGKTGSCTDGQISTSHCKLGIINETLKVEKILIFCKYWQGHDKVRWAQRCFLVFGQTGHCPRPRAPFANVFRYFYPQYLTFIFNTTVLLFVTSLPQKGNKG